LNGPAEKFAVKQGDKVEIPLTLERLYDFNQAVNFQTVIPQGVSGLQAPNLSIAAGAGDGKVTVTAQPNATPGDHTMLLRVTLNFNGQNLTFDRPFTLTVEKVEPAK
jgi:hypothetical protein